MLVKDFNVDCAFCGSFENELLVPRNIFLNVAGCRGAARVRADCDSADGVDEGESALFKEEFASKRSEM